MDWKNSKINLKISCGKSLVWHSDTISINSLERLVKILKDIAIKIVLAETF